VDSGLYLLLWYSIVYGWPVPTIISALDRSDAGAVAAWVDEVLAKMPDKVAEYRKGKKGLIGLFMGEVKKLSRGKADPKVATQLLTDKLNARES